MSFMRRIITTLLVAVLIGFPIFSSPAYAQVILRDAEAEWFIRKVSTPIFQAAGLNPGSVEIYLIYDNSINAFAFYQNMALHSGLIQKADSLNQVLGVIAHETGHIAGGHSARIQEGAKRSLGIMLASVLLGIAAAAAGSGDAATALILGGQSMAQRAFLSYSRVQEATADQAAVTYLEKTGISGKGLMEFFDKLRDQEPLAHIRQDPYVRTHPVSGDRIQLLSGRITKSRYFNTPTPEEDVYWFKRVRAKLDGYVNDPALTFRDYPVSNTSEFARYARVYAYQKNLQFDEALQEANTLISIRPNDPFYNEVAGQILFERGKIAESVPYLETALAALPREPLIMTALGHALVALDTPESNQRAREILEQAVFYDRYNDLTWHQLSIVYAQLGMESHANLATAEMWMLQRRYPGAIRRAQTAMQDFPQGSKEWLEAQDVLLTASQMLKDQRGNNLQAAPVGGFN